MTQTIADTFEALALDAPLLRAVAHEGYTRPTQVQRDSIPHALAGRDILGVAPTGTGKTAAFTLPLLQLLTHRKQGGPKAIRALILAPTRELALQVDESIRNYGHHLPFKSAVIMGGVNENPQIKALRTGVDILVATPGRLLDLMQQGYVKLEKVEFLVLDEADRMLDMGFIHDVRRICAKVPKARQTLFFSATMPREVAELAGTLLTDPVRVDVIPENVEKPRIEQRVMFVAGKDKTNLLVDLLQNMDADGLTLVFSRTKHRADRIVKRLNQSRIRAAAIHSNKTQNARQKALSDFADGRVRVLVATDIAARGLDVDDITHVINFDLSDEPENHIHRIGRTARAGASGLAISFCDMEELKKLSAIEKQIDTALIVNDQHNYHSAETARAYYEQITAQASRKKKSPGGWPSPRRKRMKTRRSGMR